MSLTTRAPRSTMSRSEAALALGIRQNLLAEYVSRGCLSKLPRQMGVYTAADLAVVRVNLAIQTAIGERSPRISEYMAQLAPEIWHIVRAGEERKVIARMNPCGVRVDIVFTVHPDGSVT